MTSALQGTGLRRVVCLGSCRVAPLWWVYVRLVLEHTMKQQDGAKLIKSGIQKSFSRARKMKEEAKGRIDRNVEVDACGHTRHVIVTLVSFGGAAFPVACSTLSLLYTHPPQNNEPM